ncbi:MAG: translational GTPase TypA [Candidatus Hinthialibacter antarcticus]|nr:translational GTPase TypA [Candidatus Hinthialibacter antarcticus]
MKNPQVNSSLRNIAIIAHVDHGKTTLVDHMFRQSGTFRESQSVDERVMDNMDLERERGITIAAKNCSVIWGGIKINILDTPGHADFGGEVERALSMVNGVILLVDASEGPLPQTRFVLQKALQDNLKVIVCINKIDRKDARPEEVLNEVYDLFIDLDANDEQIEFPVMYAIGREGIAQRTLNEKGVDLNPLFETIVEVIPGPSYDADEPFQMLVADLDYSDYMGRLAIGRVMNGKAHKNDALGCIGENGKMTPLQVTKIEVYQGVGLAEISEAVAGEIIIVAGIENVHIGDTICTKSAPKALKRITVDEPTISMGFSVNTSPFAGKEGSIVQTSKVRDRLNRETLSNVALKVEDTEDPKIFLVKGRGEFQMVILIETLRREGFELTVGRPQVIMREEEGKLMEPIEHLFVDCDEDFVGIVNEKLSLRKGRMINLVNHGTGRVRMEFSIPSRGLIGFRNEFLTDTKGTGILNSYLDGFEPHRGEFPTRRNGSLVADRQGQAVSYAIFNLEPRGTMFVTPGDPVYEGMIVGEHNRDNDLSVNICKEKKLSNMRSSGKDESVQLTPVAPLTLERAIEFIRDDELVEATPLSIRLRKKILPASQRK